jgi:hypothetical protein
MINDLPAEAVESIASNAISAIEAVKIGLDWRSPFDDRIEPQAKSITSSHPHGFGVVLADFTRQRLNEAKEIKKQGSIYRIPSGSEEMHGISHKSGRQD